MFPDLVAIAKGLTNAYLPLPEVIEVKLVWEIIELISDELGPMGHGCNYSGHPLGANAGLVNLEILEWENLTENVRDRRVSPVAISPSV